MYQLPLLVVTSPKSPALSTIRLKPGKWTFEGDVKDTELYIRLVSFVDGCDCVEHSSLGKEHVLEHPTKAQVVITKVGTEKHISVLATYNE